MEAWSNLEAQETFEKLADLLPQAAERGCAIVIRPLSRGRANDPTLVCVETGDAENMAKLRPLAFMTLEPSPHRYQCWLAVDTANWRNAAALRRLVPSARVGISAPLSQNAYVLAGSFDSNIDSAPVKLVEASAGRLVSVPQLEGGALGPYLASAHRL
jgi:hypothetical protein